MQSVKAKGAASAIIVACSMVLASGMAPPVQAPRVVKPADVPAVDVHGAPLVHVDGLSGIVGGLKGERYGLGVVPLPPPPPDKVMPAGPLGAGAISDSGRMNRALSGTMSIGAADEDAAVDNAVRCPEVRAVVLGESSEDSFAVVGDRLLHRGQALSLGGSRLVVQDLAAKQVTFVRGDPSAGAGPAPVVRCALQNYR